MKQISMKRMKTRTTKFVTPSQMGIAATITKNTDNHKQKQNGRCIRAKWFWNLKNNDVFRPFISKLDGTNKGLSVFHTLHSALQPTLTGLDKRSENTDFSFRKNGMGKSGG